MPVHDQAHAPPHALERTPPRQLHLVSATPVMLVPLMPQGPLTATQTSAPQPTPPPLEAPATAGVPAQALA
jgi:hypothetical protein